MSHGQEMLGVINSNYSGIYSIANNPSGMVTSKLYLDFNLLGVQASFRNNYIYINAEGACSIGSFDLAVTDTDLKLEGASKATLTIDGKIRLSANGASMLTYKGQATIDHLSLEGGSQIIKAD